MVVEGAIILEGKKNHLIDLYSINPDKPGKGILVKGDDNSSVILNYVRFKYLSKPVHLEKNWLRNSLKVSNCIFKFSEIYGAGIEINDIDNVLVDKIIEIKIENNTFSNNCGSLLISNISSENINTSKGNVITRNEYIGRDRNGMFTSPVFFNYNISSNPQSPVFNSNSVFNNFSNLFLKIHYLLIIQIFAW